MRKEYYLYISLIILFIIGFLYYNRPLNTQWLTDPGEEYFALPTRTLPSSWDMAEQDSSIEREKTEISKKLSHLDKILQNYNLNTWEPVFTYTKTTTGGVIEEIYQDALATVFNSWDNREVIQHHINNFARYMSGYELYPPKFDFYNAIPRFANHQSIFRVGSLYSSLLCYEGKQELCTENFRTLFKFSQQMKKSWTLISLLIGIVEEGIVINHIEYLTHSNPAEYNFLIIMLQEEHYFPAKEALHNTFVSEYNMLKNEVYNLPLHTIGAYDMINTIDWWYEQRDPTQLIIGIFKILRIPPKWLLDVPETLSLWRGIYHQIISNATASDPEYIDIDINSYRSQWHPITRKNIIGYQLLNALIPRLTGIHQRTLDQEIKFNNLINQQ